MLISNIVTFCIVGYRHVRRFQACSSLSCPNQLNSTLIKSVQLNSTLHLLSQVHVKSLFFIVNIIMYYLKFLCFILLF